jgi:hypothetical protein
VACPPSAEEPTVAKHDHLPNDPLVVELAVGIGTAACASRSRRDIVRA